MKLLRILTVIFIFLESGYSSKILGVFPSPGYSQFILCEKLMTELAKRGHDVTVISPFQPKKPVNNYVTVLADSYVKKIAETLKMEQFFGNSFSQVPPFYKFTTEITETLLAEDEVQKLITSNTTFDVVIVEQFGNEAHMGFASHFKAPLISFSSIGLSEGNSDLVGNTKLPSIVPMVIIGLTNHMDFVQRIRNTVFYIYDSFYRQFVVYPMQEQILKKYFPGNLTLNEVMNKAELILMNSHVTTTDPAILTSAIVEIGGFHISTNELPRDLKKILDEAKNGVIYFSLGSNIKSTDLPKEITDAFLKEFSRLKQTVIWNFDDESIGKEYGNLYVSKWLPQVDILAHPNVLAFITHSGLLSSTEAIYHGVPMIGIPLFADQKMNIKRVVEKNIGIELSMSDISEDNLQRALTEIINNPLYKINAKKYSNILKHSPIKPLDLAVHWVEHIIRFKGGSHLRNSSMDLNWFQLYLLDVVCFFIVITIIIILFIIIYLLPFLFEIIMIIFLSITLTIMYLYIRVMGKIKES